MTGAPSGQAIPLLITDAKIPLRISILGLPGDLIIGLVANFAHRVSNKAVNVIAFVFIALIRATPIVVQVMFIYFALPMTFSDLLIDPFTAAVITTMIYSGACITDMTHGAVLSVHKGFHEAGMATGLSRLETICHVILPLTLRHMLPPSGNQWSIGIKDTSLLIVIGAAALTYQGQEIIAGSVRALLRGSVLSHYYAGSEPHSAPY